MGLALRSQNLKFQIPDDIKIAPLNVHIKYIAAENQPSIEVRELYAEEN